MWTNFKRSNSDVDAGVGGFQILESQDLIIKRYRMSACRKFLKDIIFTKSKCDISKNYLSNLISEFFFILLKYF